MASQFGDILSDFDLNFFHQTPNNAVVNNNFEKQQRAILIAKKKIVATNALVKKFYAKKEALDHTEKALFASKEECKQIYIDYTNLIEKFTCMENEAQILQKAKQDLQAKYIASENNYAALQSHSNQLQVLIKERETFIESMKIETQLKKCGTKEYEKKINGLKKDNDVLMEHICLATDVILGKKKLSKHLKLLLQKYKKKKSKVKNGVDLAEEDNSCDEMDNFDSSSMSPSYTEDSCDKSQDYPLMKINTESSKQFNENDGKKLLDRNDSYLSTNEVVSVDTGRGSSLAFSDSDKGFHSPEYFNSDNIFSTESCINTNIPKVDRALSPIRFEVSEFIPIRYKDCKDVATSPLHFISDNESCINKENPKIDRALSPIIFEDSEFNRIRNKERKDVATSPLNFISDNDIPQVVVDPKVIIENAPSPIPLMKNINVSTSVSRFESEVIDNDQNDSVKEVLSERECLEMNSSNNTRSDKTGDLEIARILDTMRLTYDLLSPIPKTPIERHRAGESNPSHVLRDLNLNQSENSTGYVCQEAAQLREETKVLHTSIADLTKEVMNIKYLLKRKSITTDDFKNESKQSLSTQQQCSRNSSVSCAIDDDTYTINRNNIEISNVWADSTPLKTSCNLAPEDSLLLLNEEQESQKEINEVEVMDLSEDVDDSESVTADIISIDHGQKNQIYLEETLEKQKSSMNLHDQKIGKVRKLTKLQKLRKQFIPTNNIKSDIVPPKRKILRVPPKPLNSKKIIKDTDSSVSLNNKDVYEKALMVMAELKSKQKSTKCTDKLKVTIKKLPIFKSASSKNKSPTSSNEKQDNNSAIPHEQKSIESQNSPEKPLAPSNSKVNQMCTNPIVLINKVLSPSGTNVRKRGSLEKPQVESKRVLRSSSVRKSSIDDHSIILKKNKRLSASYPNDTHDYENTSPKSLQNDNDTISAIVINEKDFEDTSHNNNVGHSESENLAQVNSVQKDLKAVPQDGFIENDVQISRGNDKNHLDILNYSDLDMFTGNKLSIQNQFEENNAKDSNRKESILCVILEKYAKESVRVFPKKRADATVVCQDIEESIKQIMELPPNEMIDGMNKLVDNIQKRSYKSFLAGFIQYLKNPERKIESFNKVSSPPAPPMTKPEQILLYVVTRLKACWPSVDIVNQIFLNIEYTLFKLNDTPAFDVIETMSHFYAVLCRYFKQKTRLRLFVLDAMYCIQFKALPLIKQCIDVWMHILPLAHMGIAKTPLVTCLVYLLHFYKCEDRFKRAQDIRNILCKKYSYQMTDWNEKTILEMCRNAIKELKDISSEKKMLRMALIVLAKRRGPQWCQERIIKNILQPMIENENVPDRIKQFCVSMFGPLLKPYPVEMKIHCEVIINQLFDMLKQNPSAKMEEAIFTSLIYMSKHNYNRVIQALLSWTPRQIPPELEELLRDFVREKPAKTWRVILSRISFDD